MLVSLWVVARVSIKPEGTIDNAHSSERFRNDASDYALEEESISAVKDVEARRKEEVEVEEPASAVFPIAVHEIRNCSKIVEVKRPREPRTT